MALIDTWVTMGLEKYCLGPDGPSQVFLWQSFTASGWTNVNTDAITGAYDNKAKEL